MAEATSTASGGIGFCGLLTVAMFVLKCTKHLDVSWLIVFLPVLIPVVLLLGVLGIVLFLAFLDKVGVI